jgi:hypothetical protein
MLIDRAPAKQTDKGGGQQWACGTCIPAIERLIGLDTATKILDDMK